MFDTTWFDICYLIHWISYIFKHSLNVLILLGPLFCMQQIKYRVSLLTYISLYISYSLSVKHRRALCECAPEGWSLAPQQINTQTSSVGQCWRKTHCLSVKVPLNPGRLEKHWTKHHVVHSCRMFGPITQIGFLFKYYLIALSSLSIREAGCGPLRSGRCRFTEMKTLIELFAHNGGL